MYGKNIIDILVGVKNNAKIEPVAKQIEKLGYFRGRNNRVGDYIFLASKREETSSGDIHIHLVAVDSARYCDFMVLREYLLHNPKIANKYSKLKIQLAKDVEGDRADYRSLKSKYVDNMLVEARKRPL